MLFYCIVIWITVLLAYASTKFNDKAQVFLIILAALPPALLAGVRYNIGPDYPLYESIFDSISLTGQYVSFKPIETGYMLLNQITSFLGGDFHTLLFVIAFAVSLLFFFGAKTLSPNFTLSVFLFFVLGFYFDAFNGLRQYLAVAILFASLHFLIGRNVVPYCLLCLLASLFHSSALFMILIYPVVRYVKLSNTKMLIACAIVAFGGTIIFQAMTYLLSFTQYSYYLTSIEYQVNPTLGTTVITCLTTIMTVAIIRKEDYRESPLVRAMVCFNFLALLSALLSFSIPLALRVQYYFLPFEIVYIPFLLSRIKSKNLRLLTGMVVVASLACMTVLGMVFNGWYGALPFRSIL